MATTDDILVAIRASTTDLQRGMSDAARVVREAVGDWRRQFDGVRESSRKTFSDMRADADRETRDLSRMVGLNLGGITGSVIGLNQAVDLMRRTWSGVATLASGLLGPAAEIEYFRTRLVGLEGSAEAANAELARMSTLAFTTPFELRDVVAAGVQLKAFGDRNKETLKAVADLAAFMGEDIRLAAFAYGRAFSGGYGASEILRERGILPLVRDFARLKLGINDVSTAGLPTFRRALFAAMVDPTGPIAGATDRLAKTWTGTLSNLNDAWFQFVKDIGESGLLAMVRDIGNAVLAELNRLRDTGDLAVVAHDIGAAFEDLTRILQDSAPSMSDVARGAVTAANGFRLLVTIGGQLLSWLIQHRGAIFQLIAALAAWRAAMVAMAVMQTVYGWVSNLTAAITAARVAATELTAAAFPLRVAIASLGGATAVATGGLSILFSLLAGGAVYWLMNVRGAEALGAALDKVGDDGDRTLARLKGMYDRAAQAAAEARVKFGAGSPEATAAAERQGRIFDQVRAQARENVAQAKALYEQERVAYEAEVGKMIDARRRAASEVSGRLAGELPGGPPQKEPEGDTTEVVAARDRVTAAWRRYLGVVEEVQRAKTPAPGDTPTPKQDEPFDAKEMREQLALLKDAQQRELAAVEKNEAAKLEIVKRYAALVRGIRGATAEAISEQDTKVAEQGVRAAAQRERVTQLAVDAARRAQEAQLEAEREGILERRKLSEINDAQQYAALRALLDRKVAVQREAVERQLAIEVGGAERLAELQRRLATATSAEQRAQIVLDFDVRDPEAVQRLIDALDLVGAEADEAREKLEKAFSPDERALERKAETMRAALRGIFDGLDRAFDDVVRGVLQGTQTMSEAIRNAEQSLALAGISAARQFLFEILKMQALRLASVLFTNQKIIEADKLSVAERLALAVGDKVTGFLGFGGTPAAAPGAAAAPAPGTAAPAAPGTTGAADVANATAAAAQVAAITQQSQDQQTAAAARGEQQRSAITAASLIRQGLQYALHGARVVATWTAMHARLVIVEAVSLAKSIGQWIAHHILRLGVTQGTEAAIVVSKKAAGSQIRSESAQTATVEATNNAYAGASGAAKAVADIPYVGPILAVLNYAAVLGTLLGAVSSIISSAEGGMDEAPKGGTLALLHPRERVLSPGVAAAVRRAATGGGGAGIPRLDGADVGNRPTLAALPEGAMVIPRYLAELARAQTGGSRGAVAMEEGGEVLGGQARPIRFRVSGPSLDMGPVLASARGRVAGEVADVGGHTSITIHAVDARSFRDMLERDAPTVVRLVNREKRRDGVGSRRQP